MAPIGKLVLSLALLALSACVRSVPTAGPREPGPGRAPLSADQIGRMLEAGVTEERISARAEISGVLRLSADDLVALRNSGAGDRLLETLIREERDRGSAGCYYYGSSAVRAGGGGVYYYQSSQGCRGWGQPSRSGW